MSYKATEYDIDRLELALKNTMGDGYADELEKLVQVSKDPGLRYKLTVRGSVALQAVGQSPDYARKILREWGNAVAAVGGTPQKLDMVITQLQQVLSRQGNILKEDWKFIIQQAPQSQQAMMDLYGTGSTEELAKMGVTAQHAIREITNELSKLERVQVDIVDAYANFIDEVKRALSPFRKVIFGQQTYFKDEEE